jgi:hypothetical protein
MNTMIIRLDVIDASSPLDTRIAAECELRWVAGYRLAAAFVSGDQAVLIFQPKT